MNYSRKTRKSFRDMKATTLRCWHQSGAHCRCKSLRAEHRSERALDPSAETASNVTTFQTLNDITYHSISNSTFNYGHKHCDELNRA